MRAKTDFTEKNTMLVREFDKYILEHPEFAERIPDNALVVMQMEGDEEFNKWAKEAAQNMADEQNPPIYITVTGLKPVRSRIKKLKIELAA
ncbi:MAG: hypothetical protein NTY64_22270 [Deltaproteobacteria bacterium]|nr:hypothetical protein [Deltaproteobacteria bacterium]